MAILRVGSNYLYIVIMPRGREDIRLNKNRVTSVRSCGKIVTGDKRYVGMLMRLHAKTCKICRDRNANHTAAIDGASINEIPRSKLFMGKGTRPSLDFINKQWVVNKSILIYPYQSLEQLS